MLINSRVRKGGTIGEGAELIGRRPSVARNEEIEAPDASIAGLLRLLGGGAPGDILLALGAGPLRTTALTRRVPGYTPRTIYRHLPKLSRLGLIDREEKPTPSKVVQGLTPGCGSELCELVDRFVAATAARRPGGPVDASAWTSLAVLADLWDAGVVQELSRGPRSPTELALATRGLSYHQVHRRIAQFRAAGFLDEAKESHPRRRDYALTDKVRQSMGLIAGLGRWRERHLTLGESTSPAEMTAVLRTAAPLLAGGEEEVEANVAGDPGTVSLAARVEGSARGDTGAWLDAILDGDPSGIEIEGDPAAVRESLVRLYEVLWLPSAC